MPLPLIAHVTTVHPRHDARIYHKEAQSLRALDADVVVLVADGLGDEAASPHGPEIRDMGCTGRGRLLRVLAGNAKCVRALTQLKPAVVHFHDPELIPMGLLLKALGYKIVYDVHEDVPKQILDKHWIPLHLRRLVSRAMSAVERIAKASFDGFVAATPHIAAKFPTARTALVQNYPIATELAEAGAAPYAQRPPQIAYVGGISATRGAREMIDAMAVLTKEGCDARLQMAGLITPALYETALRQRPGWDAVTYHGQVGRKAVAALLGTARTGLVTLQPTPSYLEALPVKMFEYMAAGLPVIASDFPLWRAIVSESQCGLLVDPTQPAAIAAAIRWILAHPEEAEAMGRRGQAAVAKRYTWKNEAGELLALYGRLLGHHPGQ